MTQRTAPVLMAFLLASGCTRQVQSTSHPLNVRPAASSGVTSTMKRQIQNAVDAGDGDVIARSLRQQLEKNPGNLETRLELAAHYKKAGSPELAIEHYRLAAERFPDSQKVTLLLAEAMTNDGQTRDALQLLERFAEKKAPESSEIPSWIGILRDELGELKSAESAHRSALSFAAYSALLHNNLGYNLLLQGRHEDAAKEFGEALKISPRYELARNNLGVALASRPQGQPNEAVMQWQSVSDPATAHNNLAAVLIEQGKYSEARGELDAALRNRQGYPPALRNLALVAELDGRAATMPRRKDPAVSNWKRLARGVRWVFVGPVDNPGPSQRNEGQPATAAR